MKKILLIMALTASTAFGQSLEDSIGKTFTVTVDGQEYTALSKIQVEKVKFLAGENTRLKAYSAKLKETLDLYEDFTAELQLKHDKEVEKLTKERNFYREELKLEQDNSKQLLTRFNGCSRRILGIRFCRGW